MGKVIACTRARAGMTLMGRPPGGPRRAGLQRLPVGCRPLKPVPRRCRRGLGARPNLPRERLSELHPGRRLHCQTVAARDTEGPSDRPGFV